ncbi:MAG TPA: hypothetical protein VJ873_11245, partial [bacterium]|nr:hypothetical protein [bacterium]
LEKGRARDYVLFGTLLALSLLTAIPCWALLVLFILALLALWVGRRSAFLNQKKAWALALLVAFLWYLPTILHDGTYRCYWFPIETFNNDIAWQGSKFLNLWNNFFKVLQMLNIGSREHLMERLPFLSPWEGLFLLAGLGWCLRRFYEPSSLFIILGFLGGLASAVLTNINATLRCLAAAPFVFLLVGIGLDRLMMMVTAPLGHRGKPLKFLLGGVFLALAVGWQYDIFFNHLPTDKDDYWNPDGRIYLFGTITAKHLEGWDTYIDLGDESWQHPESDYFYSRSDMEKGQRITFRPDLPSLPLKNIPQKGALILLPDQMGEAFQGWIRYYYPSVPEKEVLNPFGDVEYRLWEINPAQIRGALKRPEPRESVALTWFDAQNRKLGRWQIPTLSAKLLNDEWFAPCAEKPAFPWGKTAYFVAEGSLENPARRILALETNGKVDGFIGNQKIHLDGRGSLKRLEMTLSSMSPDSFKIHYVLPKEGEFYLNLLEKTPLGWDMIPSSELKPR